ncbi:HEAT repeat domain-containing protein [Nodosilinea sp. E11]|uniref:HEAT repeat domain-containing protein n=1 Tax=Nodosilinea sp. E11 TaxID=3037479 RepID=UPI0029345996|nr:HEAT repeat domain-containing protein [Nodosilinea sp. E11]WOD39049.1 HEAT repeat domain-containing protein [Nodosilinea sp. E11]
MYDDDLTTLNPDLEFADPLDALGPVDEEQTPQYDPDAMLPLLTAPDPQQRMLAARAFCEVEDGRAVAPLTALLTDLCPLVRVSAAYALGRNTHESAVDPLITQLSTDWNGYVRKGLVWALGNSHDARSLMPLIEALRTDISAVRLWAASALAQMAQVGYESVIIAIPPLIEGLRRDPVPAVRSNCAWAVGQLCRELPSNVVYHTAIDALIESFAEEDDLGVREDARTALLKVGDTRGLQTIEEIEQDGFFF